MMLTGEHMASICTDPNGRKRISFRLNGARRTLRLGLVSDRVATEHKRFVEHVVACQHAAHLLPTAVVQAIGEMPDELYDRYAACGLVPAREVAGKMSLREMIRDVTAELSHKKPLTRSNYARIFAVMLEYLKETTAVAAVTPQMSDGFVTWMRNEKKYKPATVARRIKACRYAFKRAVRWGWIAKNPFDDIRAGAPIDHTRKRYVQMADAEKLLAGTADKEFRCVIALSRIGAMRCPSEILAARWIDVRWDAGEMTVWSEKTEGHEGGESRVIPLFPRLKELLWDWYQDAPEGSTYVIESWRDGSKNFRTRLGKLIDRVGLKRWPKMFHNLRASRESELLKTYPLATAAAWLGHTPEVAAKHYVMDPDKDANFRQAAGLDEATRIPTRAGGEMVGEPGKAGGENVPANAVSGDAGGDLVGADCARRDSNSLTPQGDSGPKSQPDAHSDARDPELAELLRVWPTLSIDHRREIYRLALKRITEGKGAGA